MSNSNNLKDMAAKIIAWQTGSGNITLTYTGQGNGTISVQSDANDLSVARSQQITIETTNGSPVVTKTITISQAAMPNLPYVDLGLPSGVKWATMNIGATSPEGRGNIFSWGNITEHTYGDGYTFNSNNYNNTTGSFLSTDIPVNDTYDAARSIWGQPWRIPTQAECNELKNNTTPTVETINGQKCLRLTSKISGYTDKSIVMPFAGRHDSTTTFYYWASTLDTSNSGKAQCMYGGSSATKFSVTPTYRYFGLYIRPVCD